MPGPPASQAEVRRTMIEAGGYWRPLAAVARLLEELGELLEVLADAEPEPEALASELADLWIITTALADQFRIAVGEPVSGPPGEGTVSGIGLVVAAGAIGRVVNYYDGPKTPRAAAELPSLTAAIGAFHGELRSLCGALGVDLGAAVSAKLKVIHGRDMERFARESSDPSTAAVLEQLGDDAARLWGAPATHAGADARELAHAVVPSLTAFAKAAVPERLAGYVIQAPAAPGSAELERWLVDLMSELRRHDPSPARSRDGALAFNGLPLEAELLPSPGPGTGALLLLRPCDGSVAGGPADDRT